MTDEFIKELLKENTKMSEHDINKHLKDGTFIYESYEHFESNCVAGGFDLDEIPEMWDKLLPVTDAAGKEYKIDFCL